MRKNERNLILPRIDPGLVSPQLLGTHCIAADEHYGTYKAIVLGGHRGLSDVCIDVEIIKCIKQPSDKAIFYKDVTVHREPYPVGSRQIFYINQIKPLLDETA